MKTIICLLTLLIITACAGRNAAPILPSQYGDKDLNCTQIENEMKRIEFDIRALLPKTDKTGKNVGLGIAGWFFIIPWFFMDLSDAEQIEVDAYKVRYENLRYLAQKKCDV